MEYNKLRYKTYKQENEKQNEVQYTKYNVPSLFLCLSIVALSINQPSTGLIAYARHIN